MTNTDNHIRIGHVMGHDSSYEPQYKKTNKLHMLKRAVQLRNTAKLINAFVFATLLRDFPTFSKQGPGTNGFGKKILISQIGKMDMKRNGIICIFGVNFRIFL